MNSLNVLTHSGFAHEGLLEDEFGAYRVPPGDYMLVCNEAREDTRDSDELYHALDDFLSAPATVVDGGDFEGGMLNGMACYSDVEGWSGVTNHLMCVELYQLLFSLGLCFEDPTPVKFTEFWRISKANDDVHDDEYLEPEVPDTVTILGLNH